MSDKFISHYCSGNVTSDDKRTIFTVRVRDCWSSLGYGLKAFRFEKSERIPDKASALRKIQYVFQPPRYSIISVDEGEYKKTFFTARYLGKRL